MSSDARMICPIHRHARARPDAVALQSPERSWTYAELDGAVEATCGRLQSVGVEEGSRVAIHMPRSAEYVILLWALWRQEAVAVPLSTRLPGGDVERGVRRVGSRFLVAEPSSDSARKCGEVEVVAGNDVVVTSGESVSRISPQPLGRPATVVHTSGSTGEPKAILHSWANHVYSAKGSSANIPLGPGDRWLLSLPLYHVGGLAIFVRCALRGAAVATPTAEEPLMRSISDYGATHVSLVPTQLRRLLESSKGSLPGRVGAILLGGGPIPEALLERAYSRAWPVHTSYGSTEMASQVTTTSPGAPLDTLRTAGRRLPHRHVRIDDEGRILVKGPTLFVGHIEEGRVHEQSEDEWYETGDLGFLDASGRLHVTGRADRQFVSGGENIQPEVVERALEGLDGVERAVVVSIPDEEYGRRPVAFVQMADGRRPQNWESELASVLPRFKIPDRLHELPEDALRRRMKVDYERLRELARSSVSRGRDSHSAQD